MCTPATTSTLNRRPDSGKRLRGRPERPGWPLPLLLLPILACFSCGEASVPPAVTQRLVDQLDAQRIEGALAGENAEEPRHEWRFDGPPPQSPGVRPETRGWEAGHGITRLAIRGGRLSGTTTADTPILRFERTTELDDQDLLHEIQIRLRVSAGDELAVAFFPGEALSFDQVLAMEELPWQTRTPIVTGEEFQTYSLPSFFATPSSELRQILIRPTNVAGADFEIESVRLVFRREYLATIPSGVGWHGLSGVYRESVVTRAPETIRWTVDLAENPWLDLAVGTLEETPVTFKVSVETGGERSAEMPLLERTVTTPHRWESIGMELDELAGREVTLVLALESPTAGTLGLWGSPAVRERSATAAAAAGAKNLPVEPPRGVVFILVDTLRADRLDFYGHNRATAPVMRRMAEEGAVFESTLAQGTWTKVSAASLMTSLYISSNTVRGLMDRVPISATTLAEVYREAGYATFGLSAVPFTGKFSNLHQGYEVLLESRFNHESVKNSRDYVDRLLSWLESHQEVPFFAFLHLFDPHNPYEPNRPYDKFWADTAWHAEHRKDLEKVRAFITEPDLRLAGMPNRSELLQAGIDPEGYVQRELDWYDGSIRAMDTELGRLFERLRQLGLDDKTLVVLVSDHGEEFLEHGRMFHGQTVYGELANVPLVLWYPRRIPAGTVVEETVQLIDVMPTLLELSGLPRPAALQGQSLLPLVVADEARGNGGRREWERRPAFIEKPFTTHPATPPPRDTQSTAIVFEGWKLIHNEKRTDGMPEYELYDYRRDRLDLHNVADQHPDVVERLAQYLASWRKMAAAQRLTPDSEETRSMSREELERLRALGYL